MPSKMALIKFDKCSPKECQGGICNAALACPRKLIIQEVPGEVPMTNPALCRGCGDCARACPLKAIIVTTL